MADTSIITEGGLGGYIGHALDYDAQGTAWLIVGRAPNPQNNNITVFDLLTAPRGGPISVVDHDLTPYYKIQSDIKITHTGNNLVASFTTHGTTGPDIGRVAIETWVKPGVWATTPGYEAEKGGAGGFTGDPNTGGGEVDYQRIQDMITAEEHWIKDQLTYYLEHTIRQEIVDQTAAKLAGDPGPLADLLYGRIRDGVYEQLAVWSRTKGYNPLPKP
jgi:hypothetical protein